MRRRLLIPALVLALASWALAACGGTSDDDDAAGAADPTTTTVDPDSAVTSPPLDPGVPVAPGGAVRVEPSDDVVDPLPTAFLPEEAEATDGGVLIRFYSGVEPCTRFNRYEVEETDDTVTVRLFVGASPDAAAMTCIEIAEKYEVLVPLDAPLDSRTLIDGGA